MSERANVSCVGGSHCFQFVVPRVVLFSVALRSYRTVREMKRLSSVSQTLNRVAILLYVEVGLVHATTLLGSISQQGLLDPRVEFF